MALGNIPESVINASDIIGVLPAEMLSRLDLLVTIFQAIGIATLIYLMFLIINIVLNIRSKLKIRKILSIVEATDKKIDLLLKKQTEHNRNLKVQVDLINSTLAKELLKGKKKQNFISSLFKKNDKKNPDQKPQKK